ncbi:BTB/POZ domain-containing protein [Heterostelium album PN500]|uniref:BTB/POZ domain-containing protein n=1 Tax=Heterostelium pallidum (strain ATCC 26659 / Pp 5 / PN500) TaxID=670386 RepID=D3BB54_HETP5|nr:BTB/POZ domain-containing protein [Heterostelium album PN500]EFA81791.1 BTB/POZ domain-containing protein [Heterostelium album PN500]|eukprot:XP_020433908.1 BTB/POZ domain-containing protein [Heterostelium album PN500]
MELESAMRISFNGSKSNIKKTNLKSSNEFQLSRSPITFSSGTEDSGSTDEDIFKLAKDLTNTFGTLLGDTDQPPPFSDVIFRVKGRRFFASKIMLVSRSEYFKAMFTGSMKESSVKEITLEGVEPDVFYIVLRYICIGILDLDFDIRIIGSIYNYCDLLGLNRGKELALGIMTKSANAYMAKPDIDGALQLWDSANRNMISIESIHPHLRAFIIQYASMILYSDLFMVMSEKTVCDMLRNDGLRMEELDILECVVDWCRVNSPATATSSQAKDNNTLSNSGKRNSMSYSDRSRRSHDDGESTGSCSSSRCSSRRGSIHEKETGDMNRTDSHSETGESFSGSDANDESDYDDDDFTDDDDKEDSANDDYYFAEQDEQVDEYDETIDRNLLNKLLPLIRWENMNIGEAFERLDNLHIISEKDITNLLRGIIRANRGEAFQFLGYHYRRPRNLRKRAYPLEFLMGISQPFDAPQVTNEVIALNPFTQEFGQTSNQFLYRIKKDIKLPANLERFTFKDREFFVQLKEREKGQLAVYLAFGQKITKPLAISVSASIIGFRFQDSIEFNYKKMFEEGFDSAWGWPRFISLEALQKDKYTHYGDSFVMLVDLTRIGVG